jgi:hypothetical protein
MKPFTPSFIAFIVAGTFVLSCQDKGKETPAAKEEKPECHHSITTTLTGRFAYKNNHETRECPPPTVTDMAKADRDADANFTTYGEVFCENANGCPNSPQGCKPDISNLKNMGYRTEAEPAGDKFNCYVIATVNGTISCHCK